MRRSAIQAPRLPVGPVSMDGNAARANLIAWAPTRDREVPRECWQRLSARTGSRHGCAGCLVRADRLPESLIGLDTFDRVIEQACGSHRTNGPQRRELSGLQPSPPEEARCKSVGNRLTTASRWRAR